MRSSWVSSLRLLAVALSMSLCGCDKLTGLIKSEPDAAAAVDAAPPAPVDAAVTVVPDASPTPVATARPVVAVRKDAGAADASIVDAAVDAAVAAVPSRPTRGTFTCDAPGCQCEPGVSCDITCPATGACNVVVREIATATIHGGVTPLTLQCNKGATCHVQGGVGTSRTRCTGAKCDVECHTGACNLTCEAGGRCVVAKKGVGSVKCDGC